MPRYRIAVLLGDGIGPEVIGVACRALRAVFRSLAVFREVSLAVAARHPRIRAEAANVDAVSMLFVREPASYDVIAAENQFADILGDLGAGSSAGSASRLRRRSATSTASSSRRTLRRRRSPARTRPTPWQPCCPWR
jgi:isocitrate/isopropylmalate dehydrogenase